MNIDNTNTEEKKTKVTELLENGKIIKIFLEKDNIDPETLKQIKAMASHDSILSARVMPDCHKGNGCCIGFTFPLIDKIVPNYIGGDIGCGILSYNMGNFKHNKKEKNIDELIRHVVKLGNGRDCIWDDIIATMDDLNWLFKQAEIVAKNFIRAYNDKFEVDLSKFKPEYGKEYYHNVCVKINGDPEYILKTLGTLGGGNHYIEINIDEDSKEKYLTIHSGSRNLGSKICRYHQDKTFDKFDWNIYNKLMNEFRYVNSNSTKKEQKEYSSRIKLNIDVKIHKPYLEGGEAYEYYFDMIFAQCFAQLNRRIMCKRIIDSISYGVKKYDEVNIIESIHNMIDFEDLIVRKGAIAAHKDQLCIISLNMRDGILLCKGKGNKEWNFSGPHGLGRAIDRGKARKKFRLQDFHKEMENVYSTSICTETLDESPMAYKDTDLIIDNLDGNLEIIKQFKPILNVKGI